MAACRSPFFEITTVAALLAFARTPADWTLLETGLGGRLDATNVVAKPRLTIITPISFDHQQYLGETIEEIAFEKAGILKPGVTCVVGPQPDAARTVIEDRAAAVGAPLIIAGQEFEARRERGRLVYQDESGLLDLAPPRLMGTHQIENAGVTLAALRQLGFDDAACEAALRDAEWPARMQQLRHGPLLDMLPEGAELWLDGGHNAAAGQALAAVLAEIREKSPRKVQIICGMLDTKAAEDFLSPLAAEADSLTAVAIPDAAATIPADALAVRAASAGHNASAAASVEAAVEGLEAPERVLICGSLYLAGHVLKTHG